MADLPLKTVQTEAPSLHSLRGETRRPGQDDLSGPMEGARIPLKALQPGDFARSYRFASNAQEAAAMQPLAPGDLAAGAKHGAPLHALSPNDFVAGAKHTDPLSEHDKLTQTAEKWVAQTFYGTLLKQMRDSPFKSKIFDGGRGGEAFSTLYDQRLADRMAHGAGGKLVRGIVRKIEGRKAYMSQAARDRDARGRRISPSALLNQAEMPPATQPESSEPASEKDSANP